MGRSGGDFTILLVPFFCFYRQSLLLWNDLEDFLKVSHKELTKTRNECIADHHHYG